MAKRDPRAHKLPSGSFRMQVRDPLKPDKRISLTFPSAGEAEARATKLTQIRRDLGYGLISPEKAAEHMGDMRGVLTVEDAWRVYETTLTASWKKQAQSTWTHRLRPYFAELNCVEVTEAKLRTWEAEQRERSMAPATIASGFFLLRAMLNLQVQERRLGALPFGRYRPPRPEPKDEREACRSIEELQMLVTVALRWDQKARDAGRYADMAFRILVMGLCGLRQGEASGLGWADVELDAPIPLVRVRRQATDGWQKVHPEWIEPLSPVKGRKAVAQRLHGSAAAALRGQRENLESHGFYRPNGPVFPGRGSAWRSHADCIDADDFRKLVVEAGLPNPERWVPHSLRHSCGTMELAANNGDLKATQARMRHASVEQTEKYLHRTGRGLPESKIPLISPHLLPVPRAVQALPPAELAPFAIVAHNRAGALDLVEVTTAAAQEAEEAAIARKKEARKKQKRRYVGKVFADFYAAYKGWDGSGERPPEVTEHAERARRRARATWLRKYPGDLDAANAAGQRSYQCVMAGWTRFIKQQERPK